MFIKSLRNLQKVLPAFLLALVLVFACACSKEGKVTVRSVSVSGEGSVSLKADVVSFNIRVSETAPTTSEAQQKANKKVAAILEILRYFEVEEDNIKTTSINFQSNYKYIDGEQIKTNEQVSQSISVKLNNLDKFGSLVDMLGTKLTGISLNSVSFESSDYSKAAELARSLAYENAYDKASTYAQACGLKIGKPIKINDYNDSYSYGRSYANEAKVAAFAEEAMDFSTEAPSGLLNIIVSANIEFELLK